MSTADSIVDTLKAHEWEPVIVERNDRRLELHPLEDKLGGGFTLFRLLPSGDWDVIATGHTEHGQMINPEGDPTDLPEEAENTIEELLKAAPD